MKQNNENIDVFVFLINSSFYLKYTLFYKDHSNIFHFFEIPSNSKISKGSKVILFNSLINSSFVYFIFIPPNLVADCPFLVFRVSPCTIQIIFSAFAAFNIFEDNIFVAYLAFGCSSICESFTSWLSPGRTPQDF